MKQPAAFFLLALAFLLMVPGATAGNITEVRIEDVPLLVKAGTELEFSFSVGNRAGDRCTAQVSYWIEEQGQKISRGSDAVFLEPGEVKSRQAKMLLPSSLDGIYELYLEMRCNDSTVLANKTIEVKEMIPTLPQLNTLDIAGEMEEKQIEFNYTIKSNQPEPVPVHVKEQIVQDSNIVWTNAQNIAVEGTTEIKRLGPLLPAGNYRLIVTASHGQETAKMVREFTVKAAAPAAWPVPLAAGLVALALVLLFAGAYFGVQYFRPARKPSWAETIQPAEPGEAGEAAEEREASKSVCLVEAEASGVLDSDALNSLLDNAGFSEEEKGRAFEVATRVQVIQNVRSCVLTDSDGNTSFETVVADTIVNNTNRDWHDVVVLARIPSFLNGGIGAFSSDTEIQEEPKFLNGNGEVQEALKELDGDKKAEGREAGPADGSGIIKLTLAKVGAKQSASIVYQLPKLISRDEANKISLPAVVAYREGKRIGRKAVKIRKNAGEMGKRAAKKAVLKGKRKAKRSR